MKITESNWKPISEAPQNRRILLKYDKPFAPGVSIVGGQYYPDNKIAKSKPFWANDLMMVKGVVALEITRARNNPPVGWMELPEEMNNMNELEQLRAFAQGIMENWPEGDLDSFELQDIAVRHGLLKEEIRHVDCSIDGVSSCSCATYFTSKEFEAGVQCFRKTKLLKGE